jgi:hypothetical protein
MKSSGTREARPCRAVMCAATHMWAPSCHNTSTSRASSGDVRGNRGATARALKRRRHVVETAPARGRRLDALHASNRRPRPSASPWSHSRPSRASPDAARAPPPSAPYRRTLGRRNGAAWASRESHMLGESERSWSSAALQGPASKAQRASLQAKEASNTHARRMGLHVLGQRRRRRRGGAAVPADVARLRGTTSSDRTNRVGTPCSSHHRHHTADVRATVPANTNSRPWRPPAAAAARTARARSG